MRALIVEDDARLRGVVTRTASRIGLAVDSVDCVRDADDLIAVHEYDLIVLDRRLPDGDGLSLCDVIRARGTASAILMLTAMDDATDVIDGLSSGADDYVGKPFDLDVLEARMKALLRRVARRVQAATSFGDITLRVWDRSVSRDQTDIAFTAREFAIVETLMQVPGAVITREELLERAWGEHEEPMSNTIDVLVSRIRRKLAAAGSSVTVETLRGAGYRLTI